MSNEDPQATPEIPPVPPAPPAPPVPAPQYGEYAAQPTTPPPAAPTPAPQYGYAAPLPEYGAAVAPTGRRRRTWDLVLTIVLLSIGFFGAGIGVLYGVIFSIPGLWSDAFAQQGYGTFDGDTGAAGAILILTHSLLYLATVGVSIFMLVKKYITFWVPLSVGVIAAIIFWVTVFTVIMSDPDFMTTYGTSTL
jgi:hypothetical protein